MNRKERRATAPGPAASPQAMLSEAIEYHRAGNLAKAERLYRQILAVDPSHADSLHLLGVIAHQRARDDLAMDLIGQAIALNPGEAMYHTNLGSVLRRLGRLEDSAARYREALRLNPAYLEAHNSLGLTLKDLGRPAEAAACYREAIRLRPDYIDALNNLGVVSEEAGDLNEAATCYRRALELSPGFAEAHNNLGNVLWRIGSIDTAIVEYRQAIAIKPDYADAHNNLGLALAQRGRFDEAFAEHETALRLGADPVISYYEMSHCRRFGPTDRPLVARMTALLTEPRISDAGRSQLNFALGKAMNDLGEYETAIRHFDDARRLEPDRAFDRAGFAETVRRNIETPPASQSVPSQSERPVFVVGLPRSGTTLVEQMLASHPDVATTGESDFWLGSFTTPDEAATEETIARYLGMLNAASGQAKRVIDKMPYNFLLLGLLNRAFPNARIVHCRRHPVDTALSIYFTRFNRLSRHSRLNDFSACRDDIVFVYRQYRQLMDHWRATLPPDRFAEIDYEQLVAEPEPTVRRLLNFCGLEWDAACLDFHRGDRVVSTASIWQVRQPLYHSSVGRWRRYEPWLGEFRELLAD
jgi:tetratricopeptide (TPR) repeat protein